MNQFRKNAIPFGVAAVAFVVRMAAGIQLLHSHPGVASPAKVTDMATYLAISGEILSGKFPSEFYYQPFYYSVFLPFVQFLTGPSPFMILLAQSLCGGVCVYLTWQIARRIGAGGFGAAAASVLLTFSSMAVVYTPFALLETLQAFWLTLTLYLILRAMSRKIGRSWFWPGLTLGCAILTRGNALLLLPVPLLGLFLFLHHFSWKKRWCSLFFLFIGMLLVQLPFIAVNTYARGQLSGPSTAGGNVLALGNTPEAPPGGLAYPETYTVWMNRAQVRSIPMQMYDWFCEEPGAFLEHQFLKTLQFWNWREIPNNINPEDCASMTFLRLIGGGIPTAWIMVFSLAGILCMFPKFFHGKRALVLTVLYLLLFCLATAAFYNLARFRVTGIPLFCITAGLFFHTLQLAMREKNKEEKRKSIIFLLGAAALGFAVVYPGYSWYSETVQPVLMRSFRPHGVDVPAIDGGRRVFDHTLAVCGGWMPIQMPVVEKRFSPKTPILPGTPVKLKLTMLGPSYLQINGKVFDLNQLASDRPAAVTLPLTYPDDGIFRIECGGKTVLTGDLHRNYGRTVDAKGNSPGFELVAELIIPAK